MTVSPEVRAEARRRHRRAVHRRRALVFPVALLAIGVLAGVVLAIAMEGLG